MSEPTQHDLLAEGTRLLWAAATAGMPGRGAGQTAPRELRRGHGLVTSRGRWRDWARRQIGQGIDVLHQDSGFPTPAAWLDTAMRERGTLGWLPPFDALDKAGRLDDFFAACGREPRAVMDAILDNAQFENLESRAIVDENLAVLVRRYGTPPEGRWLALAVLARLDDATLALLRCGSTWRRETIEAIGSTAALDAFLDNGGRLDVDMDRHGKTLLQVLFEKWRPERDPAYADRATLFNHLHQRLAGTDQAPALVRLDQARALDVLCGCGTLKEADAWMQRHAGWRDYASSSDLDAATYWLAANPGVAFRWLVMRAAIEPEALEKALVQACTRNPIQVLRAVGEAFGENDAMARRLSPRQAYAKRQPGDRLHEGAWKTLFSSPGSVGLLGGGMVPGHDCKTGSRSDYSISVFAGNKKGRKHSRSWCSKVSRIPPAWLWGRSEASQEQAARNLHRMATLDHNEPEVSSHNSGIGALLLAFVQAFEKARTAQDDFAPCATLRGEGALWSRMLQAAAIVTGPGNVIVPKEARPRIDAWDDLLVDALPVQVGADNHWADGQFEQGFLHNLAVTLDAMRVRNDLQAEPSARRKRRLA